jgi:methionine-rich copper-binding protein CopC
VTLFWGSSVDVGETIRYTSDVRMPCMPESPPVLRRLVAVTVAAAALLLGPIAGAAQAHDSLASSSPADGATVGTAPAAVTLVFAEAPEALGTQVSVTGPDGTSATDGDPTLSDTTVTQPLADELPAGAYAVEWQVTSDDGHPVSGSFGFTVTEGVGDAATSAPADTAATGEGAAAQADSGSSPLLWIGLGVIVAVAAALLFRQLRRPA